MNRYYTNRRNSRIAMLVSAIIAAIIVTGCWNPFSPDTGEPSPVQYYSPVDSAWKVLKNLEYSYISKDVNHYLACFRDDFEFHLLEVDFYDYDGDGVLDEYWGIDSEEEYHIAMFNSVSSIELTLSGTTEYPWTGDTLLTSYALPRTFDLKVYTVGVEGFCASGSALFVCRPDSTGEWYVWQWWDQSDT